MRLDGIHHVTCITADARRNLDYYTGTLGLRLVKKTINQDSPSIRRDAKGGVFLKEFASDAGLFATPLRTTQCVPACCRSQAADGDDQADECESEQYGHKDR